MFDARVVASFGRHCLVRDAAGATHEARPARRSLDLVCGDLVRCEVDPTHRDILVRDVRPRSSLLARANTRGGSEPVIANLTQLFVVIAPEPEADLFVLDRYLCAATSAGIRASVIANKADIAPACEVDALRALAGAGYGTLECAALGMHGVDALRGALRGEISAFVGQSGVGKSSLVSALAPQATVETGRLTRDGDGRHTTTAARIFELDAVTMLIDSPGVRDFAPAVDSLDSATLGFPEVAAHASQCRFADCRHMAEPQCGVQAAVAQGSMHARRYESYRRLRRLQEDWLTMRGPRGSKH